MVRRCVVKTIKKKRKTRRKNRLKKRKNQFGGFLAYFAPMLKQMAD